MFDGLINNIGWAIFTALWVIVSMPLFLLDLVAKVFKIFSTELPMNLLFNIKPGQGWESASVPDMFIRLTIISIIVFAIMFFVAIIKAGTYNPTKEANPLATAFKFAAIGSLFVIMIPLLVFGFLLIINVLLELIIGSNAKTISQQIWEGLYNPARHAPAITKEFWNEQAVDAKTTGFFMPTRPWWDKLPNGGGYEVIFLTLLLSLCSLIPLTLGILTLVQKIFHLLVLFVISPFVAASGIVDEGKRLRLWRDQFITKGLVICSFILGIQLFQLFISLGFNAINSFINSGSTGANDFLLKLLMMLGILVGGALSATSVSSIFTSFLGEGASVRESIGETKNLIGGAIALGSGVVAAGKLAGKVAKTATHAAAGTASKLASSTSKGLGALSNVVSNSAGAFGNSKFASKLQNALSSASSGLGNIASSAGGFAAGLSAQQAASKAKGSNLSRKERQEAFKTGKQNYQAAQAFKNEASEEFEQIKKTTDLSTADRVNAEADIKQFFKEHKDREDIFNVEGFDKIQKQMDYLTAKRKRDTAKNGTNFNDLYEKNAKTMGFSEQQAENYFEHINKQRAEELKSVVDKKEIDQINAKYDSKIEKTFIRSNSGINNPTTEAILEQMKNKTRGGTDQTNSIKDKYKFKKN